MNTDKRLTKQEARKAMFEFLKRREDRTPHHFDPCWVHCFWTRRTS